MPFEHYITSDGKRLRCGYTTGTCAALAASAAVNRILSGVWPSTVSLKTPKGPVVEVVPEQCSFSDSVAVCAVRKDGGDDVDRTDGMLIFASAELTDSPGIEICGGEGIGTVTKPGLDQPVGMPAINSVPRRMIEEAVETGCALAGYSGGVRITVFAPEGKKIAAQTFNPRLGIENGISILGTGGIVEPMSLAAVSETVKLEIRQRAREGFRHILLTPGNYGLAFLQKHDLASACAPVVTCSNFIGDALDECVEQGYKSVMLVGHAGKVSKLAGGIMNTHSRYADCRTELFCAHAAINGASAEVCRALMACATTDACIDVLEKAGLRDLTLKSLLSAVQDHLCHRLSGSIPAGVIMFSNTYGELGRTSGAADVLSLWQEEQQRAGEK